MTCETPCHNCDRKGLPILFTRYAAAYSSRDEGMEILKQLQAAGKFQNAPEGVALKTALYNVRMLRAGYLYVHIDRGEIGMCSADEWKGYAIHPHGYLFDFDVMSPASAEIKVACAREGRQANASMVWVQNPLQVKKLWYLFHPDPISPEHLFKEIVPNISKYMQSFDVAAWVSGNVCQPDTCQPGQLNGQVMEFAAVNSPSVQKVSVEQHYGLMGESGRERGWGGYREARYGKHFEPVRHEKHGIDGYISVTDDRASGGVAEGSYVAEVHAPEYEEAHGQRLKQMADLLQTKKGAVLACRDSLGIVQELSLHKLTAAIPYSTWLSSTANAKGEIDKNNAKVTNLWRETAAACLNTMVRAIHERVMKVYDEKTEKLEVQRKRLEKQDARYLPKETLKVQPDGDFEYESVEKIRKARKEELDEEIAQRHFEREEVSVAEAAKALEKTQAHYSVEALKNFTDEHAQEQIKRDAKMDAIAEDAIAWLQHISVKSNVLELYSRKQEGLKTGDGINCAAQLCAALTPMSSSPKGRAWLASLKIFGDDPKDLVWRMISFNNEEIARELLQAMSVLSNTLPATSAEDKVASVEESARQQRAFADMITALDKIPKTLAQSKSLIEASKDALGKNTPLLRRINALQKIVNTARKNIYSVFATVVTISAKNIPASLREKRLASAQLICMAHGLGQKIRPALEKMRMMELEEQKAAGKRIHYNPKKNPEPGSRAWTRMLNHLEKKQEQKIRRLAEMESDKAARSIRIPAVIGMVEAWSFFAALRRGAERGNDPRAGVEALAALANGAGALKSGMVQFFESSMYSELSARAAKPGASKVPQVLGNIASADLQALKAGAAHWVAAGSVLFAGKDLVDAKKASDEGEDALSYAYALRAGSAGVGVATALGEIYFVRKELILFRFVLKMSSLFKGLSFLGMAGAAGLTYVIGKIKEDDWIRWLESQPFRKIESKRLGFSSDTAMEESLANVIADMEILE